MKNNKVVDQIRLKGFEYDTVPSFDSKCMIAFESDSDETYIGEIIEYE